MDKTIYNNEKSLELDTVFNQSKKKFLCSMSYDPKYNDSYKPVEACIVNQDKLGRITKIAARNWYVSTGCFIKCPDNFTYVVSGVDGRTSGIYFMFLEKVS